MNASRVAMNEYARAVMAAVCGQTYPMSVKEIAAETDQSRVTVRALVESLVRRGCLRGRGGLVGGWSYEATPLGMEEMAAWRKFEGESR